MSSSTNLEAALSLAERGFSIFPVGADKRPLLRAWEETASNDAKILSGWWLSWPDASHGAVLLPLLI
jgi:hypothetical protein